MFWGAIQMFFIIFRKLGPTSIRVFNLKTADLTAPPPGFVKYDPLLLGFFLLFWQKLRPMSKDFLWITNPFARRILLTCEKMAPIIFLCIRCFKDRQMGHYVMVSLWCEPTIDFSFFNLRVNNCYAHLMWHKQKELLNDSEFTDKKQNGCLLRNSA